jgi:hypothetical protein
MGFEALRARLAKERRPPTRSTKQICQEPYISLLVCPEEDKRMRPEHRGIVQRLQLHLTQTEANTERLPRRWVELITLLNEREKAAREKRKQPSEDSSQGCVD